jgi:hypothetical protein
MFPVPSPELQVAKGPDQAVDSTVETMGRGRGGWLAKRRILVAQLDGANQRLSAMQRSDENDAVMGQRRRVQSIEVEIDLIDRDRR